MHKPEFVIDGLTPRPRAIAYTPFVIDMNPEPLIAPPDLVVSSSLLPL